MALRLLLPLAFLVALVAGRLFVGDPSPSAAERVIVIDGDTLQVDGSPVQLYGIDAPELGQLCRQDERMWRCGRDAATSLEKLVVLSGPLECSSWSGRAEEARADGIPVRVCEASREDLGWTLLNNGYAVALPGSFPEYAEAERYAREAHLGIWRGHFSPPWRWREGAGDDADRECAIKGTIEAGGERVYVVPTDPGYLGAAVDPSRGERMFCSDEAARAAGWHHTGTGVGSGA
jgi:endonuclease YncB( thermonuclease family)